MGRYEYERSRGLAADEDFYSLLMAAMRNADSTIAVMLKGMFPETWAELQARYNAPGGILPHEMVDCECMEFRKAVPLKPGMKYECSLCGGSGKLPPEGS